MFCSGLLLSWHLPMLDVFFAGNHLFCDKSVYRFMFEYGIWVLLYFTMQTAKPLDFFFLACKVVTIPNLSAGLVNRDFCAVKNSLIWLRVRNRKKRTFENGWKFHPPWVGNKTSKGNLKTCCCFSRHDFIVSWCDQFSWRNWRLLFTAVAAEGRWGRWDCTL